MNRSEVAAVRMGWALRDAGPAGALLLLVALTVSCVSTQDIESIQGQLSEIQRQMLQLQAQSANKTEVEGLSAQISRQNEALLKSEADIQLRMNELSEQLEQLQARLEDTNNRLASLSQQIASTNQELKSFRELPRFAVPESPVDPLNGPPGSTPPGVSAPILSDPKALYEAAYGDYVRGSYDLAVRQFQEYLDTFPDTDLSDNAAYWIGECFYRQSNFRQAVTQFDRVLERFSSSDKVPSALLKKGYALLELGDKAQGKSQLQRVIRDYPKSDEASLAKQRLRDLS